MTGDPPGDGLRLFCEHIGDRNWSDLEKFSGYCEGWRAELACSQHTTWSQDHGHLGIKHKHFIIVGG